MLPEAICRTSLMVPCSPGVRGKKESNVRPETRQSVPLAFDYAPSESADFIIPFLRKVFSSIAAMLGCETWEPSQIIVDKHDGLHLALDMASTILVKITTFEP
jgi:hypothetical protein